jgi:MSHA biogenesis protein MshL
MAVAAGALALIAAAAPSALAQPPQRPAPMPSLPLTQLDEQLTAADLDHRTFTLTFAQPLPINDLLMLIVRGTNLSVVPGPSVTGSFIGELKNVTVRQALDLILPPLGLGYSVDGSFIRVFRLQPETRIFDVNYIASTRVGESRIGSAPSAAGGSYANVSTRTSADIFAELTHGVETLVSEHATFNLDRQAGLLQVTDFPERLDRLDAYLETVLDHAHRQVQLDARIIEVELSDQKARSLDWAVLSTQTAVAAGGAAPPARAGVRITDLETFMGALAAQGSVSLLANPQLITMNNQPAIVRAVSSAPPAGAKTPVSSSSGSPIENLTISVTPQIAPGGIVMLSVSPIMTMHAPADGSGTTSTRESDTLARVANGETIALSGFGYDREVVERKVTGATGGWFGRSTVTTRKHVELLILLTPKILTAAGTR